MAALYGVPTKVLNQAVTRNKRRFPSDFMFELTKEEYGVLRCQFGTLKRGEHTKYLPMAFTEQGVAMLSSVVNSKQAIEVNILIMRAFVELRQMISSHKALLRKLEEIQKRYDDQFKIVFEAIAELMTPPEKPRRKIGFDIKEPSAAYGGKTKRKRTSRGK